MHKIGNKGVITHETIEIKLKSMIGGNMYEIKLDDDLKYEFYIDEIIPETNELRRMCFMSNSLSYDCACMLFGTKRSGDSVMRIESILESEDTTKKINPGNILIQILLKVIKTNPKFAHIKSIELADTSKKSCYDIGIELIYLRTITKGIPYYAKFGFRPDKKRDCEIFKFNRENYKLNKMLMREELLKIIEESKKKFKKETYKVYEKYIEPYILKNEKINPVIFFTEIIDIVDISLGKKDMIKDNIFTGNKIIKNKNVMESMCDFLNSICKSVYENLGYKEYHSRIWKIELD